MNRYLIVSLIVCFVWLSGHGMSAEPGRLQQVEVGGPLDVFLWQDVVNVYVLRDGDAAILIGLGDGSVLDHLAELGVRQLEWVLLTHHHREQCLGHRKLEPWQAKIAVPERERALLERPTSFRKLRPALSDPFTVHGASYVRPPIEPMKIDRGFQRMDTFTWRGHSFVMDRPRGLIERYHRWALAVREAYRDLSAEEDYRTMFDPYWVRADPYRVSIQAGGQAEVAVHVRNFLDRPQPYRIAIQTPPGLSAQPAMLEGTTPPETTIRTTIRLSAAPDASPGAQIVALDATLDDRRYGPWFDMIVGVSQPE